jgi:hypothetical protein
MYPLNVYVLKSHADSAGWLPPAMVEAMASMAVEVKIRRVGSVLEIGEDAKPDSGWYGVLYDNECLDEALQAGLPVHLQMNEADVLVLFREYKDGRVFQCPRFFRSHVPLDHAAVAAGHGDWKFCRVLDGVIEDDQEAV